MKRVQETSDPKSMTLLGELYSNALGIKRDDAKAAERYKQAAYLATAKPCLHLP